MIAVESIIKPKQPKGKGWRTSKDWVMPKFMVDLGFPCVPWEHNSGLFVLSAVEVPDTEPGSEKLGAQYHISISFKGGRCDRNQAKWVLKEFGLEDATEDNHVPSGRVRNYWLPVAEKYHGYKCPCINNEPAMKEDKGDFIWRGVTK